MDAVDRHRGHMVAAAAELGLHRPNLYRKLRLLKITSGGDQES
jgi:transcriptional regulator of acetoin/glycerol metabolism